MNATTSLRVEIADEIVKQPKLLEAVNQATAYLDQRIKQAEVLGLDHLSLEWHFQPEDKGWLVATLRVWDKIGGESAARLIPRKDLDDPVSRETWVLRVWQGFLSVLSRRNDVKFRQAILESEGEGNGAEESR